MPVDCDTFFGTGDTLTEQDVKQVFAVIRKKIHSGQLNNLYAVMQTFVDKVIMYHDRAEVFLNFFPNITLDFEADTGDIDLDNPEKTVRKEKKEHLLNENAPHHGGERGIRTLDGVLAHTRFPVVRLRPTQPSLQIYSVVCGADVSA